MTTERSEPLNTVIQRALRGETITAGRGPFYVTISTSSRRLVCPVPFESVEAAMLCFTANFAQLQACLKEGFQLTICIRSGSQYVH